MQTLRKLLLAATLTLFPSMGVGQDASLLPQPFQQYLDNNGNPLSGGKVFNYIPATTTAKTTWIDENKTTPNVNPVILDSAGRARIYGDGQYRQILRTSANVTIWDGVTRSTGAGGGGSTTVGDGLAVGTIIPYFGITPPANYLLAYGQAISRTTYSALFEILTAVQSVSCINGSVSMGVGDTLQLRPGMKIEASCLPAGTTVATIISPNTISTSAAATANGTVNGRFFFTDSGDGATTFNVPDLRGIGLAGRDNMGGTTATTLNPSSCVSSSTGLGARCGVETRTLVTANLPPYTPAGTIVSNQDAHDHTVPFINDTSSGQTGGAKFTFISGTTTTTAAQPAVTSIFTGTVQGGLSTGFSLIQPTLLTNYMIKVFPDTLSGDATWQVAQFCVPLGLGTGTGFGAACPSTTGIPLVSNGAAANPIFGTAQVVGGGTGRTTLTASNVLVGDGTNQVALVAPGVADGCLTSTGTATNPTFIPGGTGEIGCGPYTYVATIAALKALTPGVSPYAWIAGYYANNDGGQGLFYWNAPLAIADNGGTIIQPNAGGVGRWVRSLGMLGSSTLAVRWFGAKSDGTDASSAITAAIGALPTSGGVLLFDSGAAGQLFRFNTELSVASRRNITWRGLLTFSAGAANSAVITYGGTGARAIDCRGATSFIIDGLMITADNAGFNGKLLDCADVNSSGLSIINSHLQPTGGGTVTCLDLSLGIMVTINRVNFQNCTIGVLGQATLGSSTTVSIKNSHFIGGGVGSVAISECGEAWEISGTAFEGTTAGLANAFVNTPALPCRGIVFADNWMGDAGGAATWIKLTAIGARIMGGRISGTVASTTGIEIIDSTGVEIGGGLVLDGLLNGINFSSGTTTGVKLCPITFDPGGGATPTTNRLVNTSNAVGITAEGCNPSTSLLTAGQIYAGQTAADPARTSTPTLGVAGSVLGSVGLAGNTSGTVTVRPQAIAGTYSFILPSALGSPSDCLKMDPTATFLAFSACGAAPTAAGSATQLQFNTAGALDASPNLTWVSPRLTLGVATSTTGQLGITGATSGTAIITAQATAGTPTLTLPNASGTFAVSVSAPLALSATTGNVSVTGAAGQVLAGATPAFTATPMLGVAGTTIGTLGFQNATSGTITLSPPTGALGTVTLSLPAATDTLVGKATTDTLTNKTFNTAGTGNVFQINGTGITAVTGTGSAVLATTPTLVTPVLGVATATSINKVAVTAPATSATLTIADGKTLTVSNTITFTATDGVTVPFGTRTRCTILTTAATTCSNGGSQANNGTYTTPANVKYIIVRLAGGGGGGAGSGTTPGSGGTGGNTTFSTLTGNGGTGAVATTEGAGGTGTGGSVNLNGGSGQAVNATANTMGGPGGANPFGGAGLGGTALRFAIPGATNTGGGGGGAGSGAAASPGAGGGSGGYVEAIITAPAATYSYAVGAAGTQGAAGGGGTNGQPGGSGIIIVDEFYQ